MYKSSIVKQYCSFHFMWYNQLNTVGITEIYACGDMIYIGRSAHEVAIAIFHNQPNFIIRCV